MAGTSIAFRCRSVKSRIWMVPNPIWGINGNFPVSIRDTSSTDPDTLFAMTGPRIMPGNTVESVRPPGEPWTNSQAARSASVFDRVYSLVPASEGSVQISPRAMRFSDLKRSLGSISQKVRTTTLRSLERDGYLTRRVTPSSPPRVDHELTDLGRKVLVPVTALASWAFAHRDEIETARASFDQRSMDGACIPRGLPNPRS